MKHPRYQVRSLSGYNALPTFGRAGSAKLGTTWWVADTWNCYREVPLVIVAPGGKGPGRPRRWKVAGLTTTRHEVAERNYERLNREQAEREAASA